MQLRTIGHAIVLGIVCTASGSLGAPATAATVTPPSDLPDRRVAAGVNASENGHSVAINPANGRTLVAVGLSFDETLTEPPCMVYRSQDGGLHWASMGPLPQLTGTRCNDAVVRYAPDGSRLYAASNEYSWSGETGNLVVSVSTNDGASWSGKLVVPSSSDGEVFSGLSLTVPTFGGNAQEVWLGTSGRDYDGYWMTVLVTGSTDGGATWRTPKVVQRANLNVKDEQIFGVQIAGWRGRELVAAWGASFDDATTVNFRHEIRVARSSDGGSTFAPVQVAAHEYRPWSPGEPEPSLVVGPRGIAHIVYWSREEWYGDQGDIFYVWAPAPYSTWSAPVRVNQESGSHVQQSPSIALQTCGTASILHVIWTDNRLTPPNLLSRWNIFYSRKLALPGYDWSPEIKVSGAPTRYISQNWNDIAASSGPGRRVYALWTDGRNRSNIYLDGMDIYGSPVNSGVSCP